MKLKVENFFFLFIFLALRWDIVFLSLPVLLCLIPLIIKQEITALGVDLYCRANMFVNQIYIYFPDA